MKSLYLLSGLLCSCSLYAQGIPLDSATVQTANQATPSDSALQGTVVPVLPTMDYHFFKEPAYRISIGASFDFVNQLKPSQVYGDLLIDIPGAIKSSSCNSGIMAGLYQIRHLAVDSFIPDQLFLTAQKPFGKDSNLVRLSAAEGKEHVQLDNLYFFASIYRPWQSTTSTQGSTDLHHLFRMTSIRSARTTTTTYKRTTNDTILVGTTSNYPLLPLSKETRSVSDYWEFGFGQMLRHEFNDLALQLLLVGLFSPSEGFGYTMSFNAVGINTGVVIGAEIRTEPLLNAQLYNVFLAKTIKLKDLTKLITSY